MKKKKNESFWRINFLLSAIILGFLTVLARMVFLQVFKFSDYKAMADGQHRMFQKILPDRGKIFVAGKNKENYFPVATNRKSFLFYAVPREIKNRDEFIEKISIIIADERRKDDSDLKDAMQRVIIKDDSDENIDKKAEQSDDNPILLQNAADKGEDGKSENNSSKTDDQLDEYLVSAKDLLKNRLKNMNDPYEMIMKDMSEEYADRIKQLNFKGAYFTEVSKRYYPEQEFAADILGFVGFKNNNRVGRYGIEEFFNTELEGQPGSILGEKDTQGRWVFIGNGEINPVKNGCDIYLSLDRNIQFEAERTLKEAAEMYKIDSGSIIVINPQTGEIMAMADWPTFNPNYYGKFTNFDVFQNGIIQKVYEPGSIFKVITMSAAMNEGKVSPQTKYEDKGFVAVRDRIIRNVNRKSYGIQTMTEVFEKSLNTGAIFAQQTISNTVFLDYIKKYNFGEITGIALSGEVAGSIKSLEKMPANPVNYATSSFGQGISVTPIEMISAISAVANKGILMRPYIVSKIVKGGDEYIKKSEKIRRVISEETAAKISAMMVSVVRNGSGKPAGVDGYNIAGKTGTAQIPENGIYTNKSIHSFVGFGPLEDPAFAMLVKLDNPKKIRFSSSTAAPTFGKMAKFILEYYSIPPNR